jgi:hypothetical protein
MGRRGLREKEPGEGTVKVEEEHEDEEAQQNVGWDCGGHGLIEEMGWVGLGV